MKWTTADSYRAVFCDGGEELSDSGRDVMGHLMTYAHYMDDVVDVADAQRMLGRRDVINEMMCKLNYDPTKMVMSKGKTNG